MTKISQQAKSDSKQLLLALHTDVKSTEFRSLHLKLMYEGGLDIVELQIHRMLHDSGYLHHVILKS